MNINEQPASVWKNETEKQSARIVQFLKDHRGDWEDSGELHYSGENFDTMIKIAEGTAEIKEVNVFEQNGVPAKIHAALEGGLDVYLTGKALEAFLESA